MSRQIVIFGSLTVTFIAIGIWSVSKFTAAAQDGTGDQSGAKTAPPTPRTGGGKVDIGAQLYAQNTAKGVLLVERGSEPSAVALDPIVIPLSRLDLIEKIDVPSQRDGVLLFLGIEVKKDEPVPPDEKLFEVQLGKETKLFRRIREGDTVESNQLVAVVDDKLARAEESIKEAKLIQATEDHIASQKTRDEAKERMETQYKLRHDGKGLATSKEDVRGAELTYFRYVSEEVSKKAGIKVANEELSQAVKTVEMYQIRSKIGGVVKQLYKHDGESVKSLDPVLQVHNYHRLKVVGMVEVQYKDRLQKGMEVVLEPVNRDSPAQTFAGHRLDVTSVAVSKDPQNPLIVSGSEDGTVRVWERSEKREKRILNHPRTAVRAVACTPPGSKANLCLSGAADGIGRLWDLDSDSDRPIRELPGQHGGSPITCVAFSPDGEICATATGGQDRCIVVWNTATGEPLYRISGHRHDITSLQFTNDSRLVSASKDKTVRYWKLGKEGAEALDEIDRRADDVAQVGVTPDGKYVLDEQGHEMRILSMPGKRTESVLLNPALASRFSTVALFSPDGRLVVTTSGSEGTLQLWRTDRARSYELRQLISGERSKATSAAFAPNGSFIVGSVKDRVYVWSTPGEEEIKRRLTATITNVEQAIETSENKVRVMAEFINPEGRALLPGDVVTMVVNPVK